MTRIFLAAVTALCLALGAARAQQAPDDEKQTLVVELIEVTGMTQMMRQMIPSIIQPLEQELDQFRGRDDFEELRTEFRQIADEEISQYFDRLMLYVAPLYARVFTKQELREVIAFYKTPVGRKTVDKMPELMQGLMGWMQQETPRFAIDLGTRLRTLIEDYRAKEREG